MEPTHAFKAHQVRDFPSFGKFFALALDKVAKYAQNQDSWTMVFYQFKERILYA